MGKMRYASFSETGERTNNEDYIQITGNPDDGRYLFVCCDGMGGHAMGEVASQVVGSTICEYWEQASFENGMKPVLQTAFKLASDALDAKADVLHKVEMGTTLVLAAIDGNKLTIAYAGDSRAYLLRGEEVIYQTQDHVDHSVWEISSTVASSLIKETRQMWRCTNLSWNQVTGFFSVLMAFASLLHPTSSLVVQWMTNHQRM